MLANPRPLLRAVSTTLTLALLMTLVTTSSSLAPVSLIRPNRLSLSKITATPSRRTRTRSRITRTVSTARPRNSATRSSTQRDGVANSDQRPLYRLPELDLQGPLRSRLVRIRRSPSLPNQQTGTTSLSSTIAATTILLRGGVARVSLRCLLLIRLRLWTSTLRAQQAQIRPRMSLGTSRSSPHDLNGGLVTAPLWIQSPRRQRLAKRTPMLWDLRIARNSKQALPI